MKTFENVSEQTNKCLMRCAGVIRKEGWEDGAVGMVVYLSDPSFYHNPKMHGVLGYYPKPFLEEFMKWQEENFSENSKV